MSLRKRDFATCQVNSTTIQMSTVRMIMNSQLGRNENSIIYLTPAGDLTPLQAQIELALPGVTRGYAMLEVPKSALDPERVLFVRRVTGNILRRAGGDIIVVYRGTVPNKFITQIR
jgi:hypothetical protein